MKRCTLDSADLPDATAVYRALGQGFGFPKYFGNNPDALWDALSEYTGQPLELVWRNAAASAARLGEDFDRIAAVLKEAEAAGYLVLRLC